MKMYMCGADIWNGDQRLNISEPLGFKKRNHKLSDFDRVSAISHNA